MKTKQDIEDRLYNAQVFQKELEYMYKKTTDVEELRNYDKDMRFYKGYIQALRWMLGLTDDK